jgi:hypothetical protein
MRDGPRRRRASAWAWVYLALFGDGDEGADTGTDPSDGIGDSADETSDGPETR